MAVRKRGKRWVAEIYDPDTKRKRHVGTFDLRGEAKDEERKALAARKRRRSRETCDSFAKRWVDDYPRQRESTNIHYREQIKRFGDEFEGRLLSSIERPEARAWAMKHPGRMSVARAMFSDAMRDGLVDFNPFVGLRLPQSRGRRDLDVLPVHEVFKIAGLCREHWGPMFEAFFLTGAFVGLRPAEMYALRWPAVRFQDDEIDVLASYSSRSRETTTPKNHLQRSVVLSPPAKDALLKLERGDGGTVFRALRGGPMSGRLLHYLWDPVRKAAGHGTMTFYLATRHFCASYLLNDLELPAQDVAHQLGHQNVDLIFQLYGHPSERLARDRIKRAFGSTVVAHPALRSMDIDR